MSIQTRKQRKARYAAPLHQRQKFVHAPLSKTLAKSLNAKRLMVKKGDTVKVMVGDNKGKTGVVDSVNLKLEKVYINGVERVKKDGNKVLIPINPSNVRITKTEERK